MSINATLDVCDGCLCELANGESDLTAAEREQHYLSLRHFTVMGYDIYPDCDDECTAFSSSRCELCYGLPGRRHTCSMVMR
jgi:hypothetical protein